MMTIEAQTFAKKKRAIAAFCTTPLFWSKHSYFAYYDMQDMMSHNMHSVTWWLKLFC